MPITLNHSNIGVQYSTGSNYIIETVKSDLYRKNEIVDTIVRDNIQVAPVTPTTYVDSGNVYAVESYTYSGTANTADFTRVFTKSTTCDILVIGGGGAGGGNGQGGGGGAGAVIYYEGLTLNGTYNIKTGKGANATLTQNVGDNGVDSEFLKIDNTQRFLAKGGGGGGTYNNASGYLPRAGGSGGGGAGNSVGATIVSGNIINGVSVSVLNDNYVNTNFTGNRGINSLNDTGCFGNKGGNETSGGDDSIGAGGGGAGEVGTSTLENQTGNKDIAGNGGSGKKYNISGVEKYYGGGGGGGLRPYPADSSAHGATSVVGSGGNGGGGGGGGGVSVSSNGFDAENGTGGGGGGVGGYTSANFRGGAGGSGIVIIRYLLGTIPVNNYLTAEPSITPATFTETTRTFAHSGGAETQTTHTITVARDTICDILVVGGGGGGGLFGGGGGAGSILFANNLLLNAGSYTIKVGKGGTGASNDTANGTNGIDSSILINAIEYISKGGGGGGSRNNSGSGFAGRNGSNGGSGGGGSQSDTIETIGGSSTKNTYTYWETYGNAGGKGKSGATPWVSGGGGGAGSAGSDWSNTKGGNGGSGKSFVSYFGTNVGHNGWFGGGGGGNMYSPGGTFYDYGYGNGGNGLSGGGGNGANETSVEISAISGLPNTGGGGGGGKWDGSEANGGNGGSGIVIIKFKSTTPILEGITHKRLNFAFDSLGFSFDATKYAEYQAQQKTGVGGWRIVRFLPPNLGRWYQGDYINSTTFTIPTIGTPYNYTNEWAVSFGTFDEMFFATFDMTYWLHCLKTSVLGNYDNGARPIIKSSERNYAHSINWYNRTGVSVDPFISINNHTATPNLMVYADNNSPDHSSLRNAYGGMCVLVRDSATGATIPNPNTYTLNFPVPTLADINNNSNIVLRGAYDIALSTSNALIIPKEGQHIHNPSVLIRDSSERIYPPIRNFTAATTTVSGQSYGNGTYIVSASTFYDTSGNTDFTIFNGTNSGWVPSTNKYDGTGGTYSGLLSLGGFTGEWIKVQFPVSIKLTRYIIEANAIGGVNRAPSIYKIFGSNNNIDWEQVVYKSVPLVSADYISSKYEEKVSSNNYYRFFALVVGKIIGGDSWLSIGEWYIYGQEFSNNSLSIRYNILNPILDPIGAQWTYSSSNTNVYHMGSVGIGTTSPEYQLDVRGAIYSSVGGYTSSTLTKWSVLSDRRIKENIAKASYDKCLENVKNIELYNFNFKDNCVNTNDKHQLGFIAQEVQQVYPKAVEVGKMIVNLEEKIDDLLTLNITQIDYTLYGAVKSLIEKIENIKIKMEHIKTTYDIP